MSTKLRIAVAALVITSTVLLTGCAGGSDGSEKDSKRDWSLSELLGADKTPAPEPDGTADHPYVAPQDNFADHYKADWVVTPDGRRVLCIRYSDSSNGSDPISCDFVPDAHPPAAGK